MRACVCMCVCVCACVRVCGGERERCEGTHTHAHAPSLPQHRNSSLCARVHLHGGQASEILANLFKIVARGGNYLVNIGPQPDGAWPQARRCRVGGVAVVWCGVVLAWCCVLW